MSARANGSPPQMPDIRLHALPESQICRPVSCRCGGVHIQQVSVDAVLQRDHRLGGARLLAQLHQVPLELPIVLPANAPGDLARLSLHGVHHLLLVHTISWACTCSAGMLATTRRSRQDGAERTITPLATNALFQRLEVIVLHGRELLAAWVQHEFWCRLGALDNVGRLCLGSGAFCCRDDTLLARYGLGNSLHDSLRKG
jgi:hypothetical protein